MKILVISKKIIKHKLYKESYIKLFGNQHFYFKIKI